MTFNLRLLEKIEAIKNLIAYLVKGISIFGTKKKLQNSIQNLPVIKSPVSQWSSDSRLYIDSYTADRSWPLLVQLILMGQSDWKETDTG